MKPTRHLIVYNQLEWERIPHNFLVMDLQVMSSSYAEIEDTGPLTRSSTSCWEALLVLDGNGWFSTSDFMSRTFARSCTNTRAIRWRRPATLSKCCNFFYLFALYNLVSQDCRLHSLSSSAGLSQLDSREWRHILQTIDGVHNRESTCLEHQKYVQMKNIK